jgi:hypothetical protein
MATQQGDWDKLGHEVCDGGVNIFSAYFEPDLDDDIGSYTITNIQPHLFKAQTSANDADNPTWNEALNSPFAERWWQSMEVEINTLENDLQAWELVEREPWMNVLPSTWAFKLKRFPDGLVKKFKARFCVRGDKQKEGVDFFETWSPVVQWTTVRSMLILATQQNLVSAQADITAAFVHANLKPDENIFVHQPRGFKRGSNLVLKLKRSVYGLKQAPRYFFKYLCGHMQSKEVGLKQSQHDPCLFIGKDVIAVVYVDDILFFAQKEDIIVNTITKLQQAGIAIRREGTAEGFLGVDVERTIAKDGKNQITLTQSGLTQRIITALGLNSSLSTPLSTPAEASPLPRDIKGDPPLATSTMQP